VDGGATPLAVYPIWCAFATLLSGHVWFLNRHWVGDVGGAGHIGAPDEDQ
jgi:hypothetical protein